MQPADDSIGHPTHAHHALRIAFRHQKSIGRSMINGHIVRHIRIQFSIGCRSQRLKMCGKKQSQRSRIFRSRRPDRISKLCLCIQTGGLS